MAVTLFPAQVSDLDYHHGVLHHVLNPNAEDHHDPSGWAQDVETVVSYVSHHTDAVSKKYSRAIADEAKWGKIRAYLQAVQGAGRDAAQIVCAMNKMKVEAKPAGESAPSSFWSLFWNLPSLVYRMCAGFPRPEVFTKCEDKIICHPAFHYDSSGAFLKALEEQLEDLSWKSLRKDADANSWLSRKDAEALVKANIHMAPAYLFNLHNYIVCSIKEAIEKSNPLLFAILQGDLNEIEILIQVPQYRTAAFGHTELGIAVLSGNLRVVKALVDSTLFDLDEKGGKGKSVVELASLTGHLPILKFLLERGAKPDFSKRPEHLQGAKLLFEKGSEISPLLLRDFRADNTASGKRFQEVFKDKVTANTASEVNERFHLGCLSHAWQKKGELDIKRKDQLGSFKMNLEGSRCQLNCELMSRIWKEFCQSHPRDIPANFGTWLGDALMDAAQVNTIGEGGLFERYERGDLTIIAAIIEYPASSHHAVGICLLKDYFCILDGGPKRTETGSAIFHGKFQPDLMTEEIIKKISSRKRPNEHEKFFYQELPTLIDLKRRGAPSEYFLKRLDEKFASLKQKGGHCGWFNFAYLPPFAIGQHLYDTRDKTDPILLEKGGESAQIEQILDRAWDISLEWVRYAQAYFLRQYLFSATREVYEINHTFIKKLLKSSWHLYMGNYSQATKNILYSCEKRYLELLSEGERAIYKADKVVYLVKARNAGRLYPSILSLKKKRLI